uniref:Uncharacterized protein n=1 Tax=Aeromonas salmonicida subsp. salmonicida TaxID=29491 RepID=A0A1I9S243_AERSS|nr:putative hypothetical protein [Aeromonas salmonicida subsp. salmonicida]
MAQQRPTGDPSSATSPADRAPRAVAALQLTPACDHPPLGARPPDRVAHQVMISAHRRARGLGHRPAAPHR